MRLSATRTIITWSLVALAVLLLFPFVLNFVANHMEISSQGDFNGWLGFMGSYIGGIVSGAITFIGVLIGFHFERRKNLAHRYLSVSVDIENIGQQLEDDIRTMQTISKIVDKNSRIGQEDSINWFKKVREKYKKYEKICGSVDLQLLREMKQFNSYLFNLYIEFEMSFSLDETIAESGDRNFIEDFENLKNSEKKLQTTIKELGLISKKYQ